MDQQSNPNKDNSMMNRSSKPATTDSSLVTKATEKASELVSKANETPKEGKITKEIEKVTSQIPSGGYLTLAIGSLALSATLAAFSKRKSMANFVGLWVPTFLLFGIYNKIVKVEGSDQFSKNKPHENLH